MARTRLQRYDKSAVKRANERLRKLEVITYKGYDAPISVRSPAYRTVQKYAMDKSKMSSKFYRTTDEKGNLLLNKDGTPAIRFITHKQFEQMVARGELSEYEQTKFMETVNNFLNARTSIKIGYEEVRQKQYEAFMANHDNLDWSMEDYEKFWESFGEYSEDKQDKARYGQLTKIFADKEAIENLDLRSDLKITDDTINAVLNYNRENRYNDVPGKTEHIKSRRLRN